MKDGLDISDLKIIQKNYKNLKMIKQILILQFCLFTFLASCQEKKQVNQEQKQIIDQENKEEKEEKQMQIIDTMQNLDMTSMKKMLNEAYYCIDTETPIYDSHVNWINSEILKSLLSNGYKMPTREEFQAKIQKVFGVNMKINQPCRMNKIGDEFIFLYGSQYMKDEKSGENKGISRSEYFPSDYTGNIVLMLKNSYMSFLISPVRVVEFPIDSASYKVKIPQYVISRNKYILNDDKSQFPWLVTQDEFFMRSLVTDFGYTEDKKLLQWVIENTHLPFFYTYAKKNDLQELGKLLWTKDCNGEIRIHQNTLDILKEMSTPDKNLYIMYVAEYLSNYLVSSAIKEEKLTIEQKAKIAAHLLYWGEQYKYDKHYDYNQMFMGHFWHIIDNGTYEKEFKKNNYYGLPKFKEWYEAAKKEENIFEGYENYLNDEPQPLDYKHKAEPIK